MKKSTSSSSTSKRRTHHVTLYDRHRDALRDYQRMPVESLPRKAGSLASRLRLLNLVYWEKTGQFILPVACAEMLKPLEGLGLTK